MVEAMKVFFKRSYAQSREPMHDKTDIQSIFGIVQVVRKLSIESGKQYAKCVALNYITHLGDNHGTLMRFKRWTHLSRYKREETVSEYIFAQSTVPLCCTLLMERLLYLSILAISHGIERSESCQKCQGVIKSYQILFALTLCDSIQEKLYGEVSSNHPLPEWNEKTSLLMNTLRSYCLHFLCKKVLESEADDVQAYENLLIVLVEQDLYHDLEQASKQEKIPNCEKGGATGVQEPFKRPQLFTARTTTKAVQWHNPKIEKTLYACLLAVLTKKVQKLCEKQEVTRHNLWQKLETMIPYRVLQKELVLPPTLTSLPPLLLGSEKDFFYKAQVELHELIAKVHELVMLLGWLAYFASKSGMEFPSQLWSLLYALGSTLHYEGFTAESMILWSYLGIINNVIDVEACVYRALRRHSAHLVFMTPDGTYGKITPTSRFPSTALEATETYACAPVLQAQHTYSMHLQNAYKVSSGEILEILIPFLQQYIPWVVEKRWWNENPRVNQEEEEEINSSITKVSIRRSLTPSFRTDFTESDSIQSMHDKQKAENGDHRMEYMPHAGIKAKLYTEEKGFMHESRGVSAKEADLKAKPSLLVVYTLEEAHDLVEGCCLLAEILYSRGDEVGAVRGIVAGLTVLLTSASLVNLRLILRSFELLSCCQLPALQFCAPERIMNLLHDAHLWNFFASLHPFPCTRLSLRVGDVSHRIPNIPYTFPWVWYSPLRQVFKRAGENALTKGERILSTFHFAPTKTTEKENKTLSDKNLPLFSTHHTALCSRILSSCEEILTTPLFLKPQLQTSLTEVLRCPLHSLVLTLLLIHKCKEHIFPLLHTDPAHHFCTGTCFLQDRKKLTQVVKTIQYQKNHFLASFTFIHTALFTTNRATDAITDHHVEIPPFPTTQKDRGRAENQTKKSDKGASDQPTAALFRLPYSKNRPFAFSSLQDLPFDVTLCALLWGKDEKTLDIIRVDREDHKWEAAPKERNGYCGHASKGLNARLDLEENEIFFSSSTISSLSFCCSTLPSTFFLRYQLYKMGQLISKASTHVQNTLRAQFSPLENNNERQRLSFPSTISEQVKRRSKRNFWKTRLSFDAELKKLLSRVEKDVLGAFSYLLLPSFDLSPHRKFSAHENSPLNEKSLDLGENSVYPCLRHALNLACAKCTKKILQKLLARDPSLLSLSFPKIIADPPLIQGSNSQPPGCLQGSEPKQNEVYAVLRSLADLTLHLFFAARKKKGSNSSVQHSFETLLNASLRLSQGEKSSLEPVILDFFECVKKIFLKYFPLPRSGTSIPKGAEDTMSGDSRKRGYNGNGRRLKDASECENKDQKKAGKRSAESLPCKTLWLLLDDTRLSPMRTSLHHFPWESLPLFASLPFPVRVIRIPSLRYALRASEDKTREVNNEQDQNLKLNLSKNETFPSQVTSALSLPEKAFSLTSVTINQKSNTSLPQTLDEAFVFPSNSPHRDKSGAKLEVNRWMEEEEKKSIFSRIFYCLNPFCTLAPDKHIEMERWARCLPQSKGMVGRYSPHMVYEGMHSSLVYLYMGHGTGERIMARSRLLNYRGIKKGIPVLSKVLNRKEGAHDGRAEDDEFKKAKADPTPIRDQNRLKGITKEPRPFHPSSHVSPASPVAILMGCSSAALDDGPYSFPYTLLLCGTSRVICTLWDVTDGEIDQFTRRYVERVHQKIASVAFISPSRLALRKDSFVNMENSCKAELRNQKEDEDNYVHVTRSNITRIAADELRCATNGLRLRCLTGASLVCYGF